MKNYFSGLCGWLCTCVLLAGCSSVKVQTHKLKVSVPFSSQEYITFVNLSEYDAYTRSLKYDSIENKFVYIYDSIPEGKVTLNFFSLLTNDYSKTIQLNTDTTIIFDKNPYWEFRHFRYSKEPQNEYPNEILKLKVEDKDTFYIGATRFSCTDFQAEKIKIFKVDTNYQIEISNPKLRIKTSTYFVPEKIFDKAFNEYINACQYLFPGPTLDQIMLSSTLHSSMYIRKGDIIYNFPPIKNWDGYCILKSSIQGKYKVGQENNAGKINNR